MIENILPLKELLVFYSPDWHQQEFNATESLSWWSFADLIGRSSVNLFSDISLKQSASGWRECKVIPGAILHS